jgi:outer membrane murein-binding lipoprotein Lpp
LQRNFQEGNDKHYNNRFNYQTMKKLVLFAAVAAMVAFSSCSNKAKEEVVEPAIEEVAPAVEETIVEELVVDSAAVEAPAETPAQ